MLRAGIAAAGLVLAFGRAPLQCAHDPGPDLRRADTPGDAVWELAEDLRAHHDDEGAELALRFLVARYPSSRHAQAARDLLGGDAGAGAGMPAEAR